MTPTKRNCAQGATDVSTFSAIDIGRTGIGFSHHWIDTIAHNLANLSTMSSPDEEPFRAVRPVVQPRTGPFSATGSGVATVAHGRDDGQAPLSHDPSHPLADPGGFIAGPVIDMAGMMTDLITAQRHYQANVRTVQAATEAYESALRIGSRQ